MNPLTVAIQAPLSMAFFRQEYWSGLPFPSPGELPDPGIKTSSPASLALAGGFFTTEPPGPLRSPLQHSENTGLQSVLQADGKKANPAQGFCHSARLWPQRVAPSWKLGLLLPSSLPFSLSSPPASKHFFFFWPCQAASGILDPDQG